MLQRMHGAARGWRILFAIVGWAGLTAQYLLLLQAGTRSVLGSTMVFFSYFTILTNVLVGRLAHVPIHRALMGLKEQFRHHHGERPWPGTAAAVP